MTEPQVTFDFEAARRARDIGMQRSADHANHVEDGWTETAYANLCLLRNLGRLNTPTLAEDIRAMAYGLGLHEPPDGRAWGSVFSRARRDGLLSIAGHAKAKSSNCSPKPLWVKQQHPP